MPIASTTAKALGYLDGKVELVWHRVKLQNPGRMARVIRAPEPWSTLWHTRYQCGPLSHSLCSRLAQQR